MSKKYKILVLRFSSIGDILLTTPILRCIKKKHPTSEVSFMIKSNYQHVIKSNIYIDKIICFEKSIFEVIKILKKEKYDLIIDLHKNIRTFFLRLFLMKKSLTYKKYNFRKWLLINSGINIIPENHIVDRYFTSINKIGILNDNKRLDFFIKDIESITKKYKYIIKNKYIVFCLGASFINKRISVSIIKKTINYILGQTDYNIVLLGGDDVQKDYDDLDNQRIIDLINKTSFTESAFLLKKSFLVITPDTGLMHLASVFNKKIISVWGCTSPLFGFRPYLVEDSFILTPNIKNHKPCSKHGKYCKYKLFKCIDKIDAEKLIQILKKQIKLFDK